MSAVTLHAVLKVCQKPAAGLKALALIDPLDLAAQPTWHIQPTVSALSFLPGKAAFAFHPDGFSGRLSDKTNTASGAGDYIDYLLQASVSGVRPETEWFRAKLLNRRVHIVATYQNDLQRFVPYMRLAADGDSGDRSTRNGYSFSGTARLPCAAPFLEATFDVIDEYTPPSGPPTAEGVVTLVTITTDDPTYTYAVPAGKWLDGIEVRSTDAQTLSIGTSPGGDELSGMPVPLSDLQPYVANGALLDTFGSHTIYFSGLEGTNTIKIWLLG